MIDEDTIVEETVWKDRPSQLINFYMVYYFILDHYYSINKIFKN